MTADRHFPRKDKGVFDFLFFLKKKKPQGTVFKSFEKG